MDASPLNMAIESLNVDLIKYTIEARCSVNRSSGVPNQTPLELAYEAGVIDFSKILLENKATVDNKFLVGDSATNPFCMAIVQAILSNDSAALESILHQFVQSQSSLLEEEEGEGERTTTNSQKRFH